jgi:hypothetical protein
MPLPQFAFTQAHFDHCRDHCIEWTIPKAVRLGADLDAAQPGIDSRQRGRCDLGKYHLAQVSTCECHVRPFDDLLRSSISDRVGIAAGP